MHGGYARRLRTAVMHGGYTRDWKRQQCLPPPCVAQFSLFLSVSLSLCLSVSLSLCLTGSLSLSFSLFFLFFLSFLAFLMLSYLSYYFWLLSKCGIKCSHVTCIKSKTLFKKKTLFKRCQQIERILKLQIDTEMDK